MTTHDDLLKVPFIKPEFWYMDDECQNIINTLNKNTWNIKYIIWIGYDKEYVNLVYMSNKNYPSYLLYQKLHKTIDNGFTHIMHRDSFTEEFIHCVENSVFISNNLLNFINRINIKCNSSFKYHLDSLLELNYTKSMIMEILYHLDILIDLSNIICSYIGVRVSIYDFNYDKEGNAINIYDK